LAIGDFNFSPEAIGIKSLQMIFQSANVMIILRILNAGFCWLFIDVEIRSKLQLKGFENFLDGGFWLIL